MRLPCSRPHPLLLVLALGCARAQEASPPPAPRVATEPGPGPACVYFKELKPFLPRELAGYALAREEGSTGKYGEVQVSEAERVFSRPGQQVAVRIVDTTLSEKLGHSIRTAASGADKHAAGDETSPLRLEQTVGFVRYDPTEEKAEANLLVGGRYVVAVTSMGFESTHEVRRIAEGLDLTGLSKLR